MPHLRDVPAAGGPPAGGRRPATAPLLLLVPLAAYAVARRGRRHEAGPNAGEPEPGAAPPPPAPPLTPPSPASAVDWLARAKEVAGAVPTLAAAAALALYAVVRVAHDAFYSRFGVTPEGVGLTQAAIVGRAALYLAFFLMTAFSFVGLWLAAVVWVERPRARTGAAADPLVRLLVAGILAGLAALPLLVLAAPAHLRGLQRAPIGEVCDRTRLAVHQLFCQTTWLGSGLPVAAAFALPLGLALLAACAALAYRLRAGRGAESSRRPALVGSLLALGVVSFVVSLAAPDFVGLLADVAAGKRFALDLSTGGAWPAHAPWLESHVGVVKWLGFAILFAALGSAALVLTHTLGRIGSVEGQQRRQLAWLLLAFVLVALPLLTSFFAPAIPAFVRGSGDRIVVAAVAWAALAGVVATPLLRGPHPLDRLVPAALPAGFAAVLVASLLFLADARGAALARQALAGNRIIPAHFELLAIQSDVVCLVPVSGPLLGPYVYLGTSQGQLVLFDFERRLGARPGAPSVLPVRVPAGGYATRIANRNATNSAWVCTRERGGRV